MQREKPNLLQIGIVVAVVGALLQVLYRLTFLLAPIAHLAVVVGVILIVAGLIMPNRRY